MRRFRFPLTCLAGLALLFNLWVIIDIYQFGFPPNDLLGPENFEDRPGGGVTIFLPAASTRDMVAYGLLLVGIGVVQAFLFRLTWKVWRR